MRGAPVAVVGHGAPACATHPRALVPSLVASPEAPGTTGRSFGSRGGGRHAKLASGGVQRKLCSVATPATYTVSPDLLDTTWSGGTPTPPDALTKQRVLVAITQRVAPGLAHGRSDDGTTVAGASPQQQGPLLGAAVLHAELGRVEVFEWRDDPVCSRLKSLLRRAEPVELVTDSVLERALLPLLS